MGGAQLTVITATNPARLSKHFSLKGDGTLRKHSGGSLTRGHSERRTVATPHELADLLSGLETNQALTFGVASKETAPIASKKRAQPGEITRTRDYFDWQQGPGWLLIDYDPADGQTPLTAAELRSELCDVVDGLGRAPMVVGSSGSAHIYHAETDECLKGAGGLRMYILVADARDIPRAGAALCERLWAFGKGYYSVSKSGALLERTLIDASVWQPERLDFAAGAACATPLEQRRPEPEWFNNDAPALDTAGRIGDLPQDLVQYVYDTKAEARAAMHDEQETARANWIEDRITAWETRNKAELDTLSSADRAAEREEARDRFRQSVVKRQLFGDFELECENGQKVTVGEIMDDQDRWHGKRFADPLEPDYNGDKRIAHLNLKSGGKPFIYSHAHGGQRYTLIRASGTIRLEAGEMPRILREADAIMAKAGEVFQRAGSLVRVTPDGSTQTIEKPWLRTHLESIARFERWNTRSKGWVASDSSVDMAERLIANSGEWSVPELTSVVRGPILREDGSLLTTPGHDRASGLLLMSDNPDRWPNVPAHPTEMDIRRAFKRLWEPFAEFPFKDDLSRGVHLAALLTAVQRPMLETAPAFAYNAPMAGSGKTKLAKAATWLAGGEPRESPWSDDAEEQRKRLMSALLGTPTGLVLDNISGPMRSDTLCSILTASTFRDRVLGSSKEAEAPTRIFVTVSGNNLRLEGDLSRRVLVSTIDHQVEHPEKRRFGFDPVARVRENWLGYRAAALTLLNAFVQAGSPQRGDGTMGSFEQWDRTIRQCVVWLRDKGYAHVGLGDPMNAVENNYAHDPDTQKLQALMYAWHARHGDTRVRVKTLIDDASCGAGVGRASDSRGALFDALDEIGGERGHLNSRRIGRWIEQRSGRISDGMKIEGAGSHAGSRHWRLVRCGERLTRVR